MRARRSNRTWRWRAAYFVTLGTATAALIAGVALATGGTGSGFGSASTGSVALNVNSSATHTCTYTHLLPGDLPNTSPCTFAVSYSGSISAFVSLTVAVQSKAGSGGYTLYNGNTAGLTFSISDGHTTFVVPAGSGTGCSGGYTCWTSPNDLAAWYSGSTPNLTFASADAVTWTVTPSFLSTVGNHYEGATATLILTAQAVQTPANALPGSCTTSTIGQSCPNSNPFTWS